MILTCPNCATRYVVGDTAVPPDGRTVRCAHCGERWRATPEAAEPPLELKPTPAQAPAAPSPPAGFGRGAGAAEPAPVSKAFRQQVQERKRTRQAMTAGVVFAAASAVVVALVLLLVLFPVAVVRTVPRMAGVYAALRHPVNPTGLALEAQGEPGLAEGRPVLTVRGVERNVEARPRASVPLRVKLFDKGGRAVAQLIAPVDPAPVAPGEARPFRATFTDPPLSAVEFGVELAFDLPRNAAAPLAAAVRPPVSAPPVSEARPLPAGSEYALPPPAAGPHG